MDEFKSVNSSQFSGKKIDFLYGNLNFWHVICIKKCDQILLNDNNEAPASQEILDILVAADKLGMKREWQIAKLICY
jgi:hypothetical protein